MKTLSPAEVDALLAASPGWTLVGAKLERVWQFKDFAEAMVFVQRVAVLAQQADHHPDIDIRYNQVRLSLISHDANALTPRDAKLVSRIDQVIL